MAPRFDPESLKLDLSVADLLESPFLRSLGFSSRGGYERLWLGQAIHGRYQEEKLAEDPTYKREVVISHTFEHRGWRVTVQGRADGLRREPDGSLVVEVQARYPWQDAAEAHRAAAQGHTRGKIVLVVDDDLASELEI